MDVRVDFEGIPWEAPAPGIRFKTFTRGAQQLRVLELSEPFDERDWCTRGHAFHLLEGELSLQLHDRALRLKAGDVGVLGPNEEHRHKASVGRGGCARLLLFETVAVSSSSPTPDSASPSAP